jgi:hypothetical protein
VSKWISVGMNGACSCPWGCVANPPSAYTVSLTSSPP